jgi:hypothetical protein
MNKVHQDYDMQTWYNNIRKGITSRARNTAKGIFLSSGFSKKPPGAVV